MRLLINGFWLNFVGVMNIYMTQTHTHMNGRAHTLTHTHYSISIKCKMYSTVIGRDDSRQRFGLHFQKFYICVNNGQWCLRVCVLAFFFSFVFSFLFRLVAHYSSFYSFLICSVHYHSPYKYIFLTAATFYFMTRILIN